MNIVFDGLILKANIETIKELLSDFIKDKFDDQNPPFKHAGKDIAIHVSEINNTFLVGNIITIKDIRSMPTVTNSKFSTIDFTNDNPPIDFNYFIIDKTDLSGIYSSYKGSFSIFMFADLLLNRYKTFYDKQISRIDKQNIEPKENKKAKNKFKVDHPKPEITLEASSQTFLDKVQSLACISQVEHAVAEDTQNDFSAISGFAKSTRRIMKIDLNIGDGSSKAKTFVSKLFGKNSIIDFLAVTGKDSSQRPWTYNYKKNYKKYDKIKFEDALDLIRNKYTYELSNDMIKKMIELKRE